MTIETAITEELQARVGVESEPKVFYVERGHIQRFAESIEDPNPLWQDEEYASKSRYGSIIAPPIFMLDMANTEFMEDLLKVPCPLPRLLNGGIEVEYYQPLKVGDTITTVAKLAELKEPKGRAGKMLLMFTEATYTNQRSELAMKCRWTFFKLE